MRALGVAGWGLLVLLLPLVKWTESPSWSMFLHAEDADLFLRQAIDLGASAVVTPYAGYFHLYSRLVAWMATLCSPALYPAVMAAGWCLAYAGTCLLLVRWTKAMGLPVWWGVVVLTSVLLQPHGGEVYFSVTNAQWWLGLYLFVYFIWFDQRRGASTWERRLDRMFIVLASLSGPFAFMVWPVMLLRRWTEGSRHAWSWLHAWVLAAGLLQLGAFLLGDRVHRHDGAVFHLDQWALAFCRLLVFCADDPVQLAVGVALLMACAWLVWLDQRAGQGPMTHDAVIVACCIGYLLLAGIWAHKFDPMQAVPPGTGNRYTWIPYALFFLLVCRSVSRAPGQAQVAVVLLLIAVCDMGHRSIQRGDLQYSAFTDFAKLKAVRVPMHPQVESWPGWFLELGARDVGAPPVPRFVYAPGGGALAKAHDGGLQEDASGWRFTSAGPDPRIVFGSPLHCEVGRSIGVEVRMWRASPGWVQLFWSRDDRFSGRRSLRRFYPAAAVVAQFAFRNLGQPTYLRLDPADADVDALIQSVDVHCLAENRP